MNDNEIARIIVDISYKIHTRIGPGLLESAYQSILTHELKNQGLVVETERVIPIHYEGIDIDAGYRADIIVENSVIIELKSIEQVHEVHKKQLLTYLKVSNKHQGLLINFGAPRIKDGITRIVNNLQE